MKYRKDKNGNDLSVLGFGCMRFQKKRGKIDMAEAEREIMTAYNSGVNYFDTAFIYPGSEAAIGEIFEKNGIRDKVYIATKLPPQLMRSVDVLDKLFNEQLKRLRTDYIDFYLFHMMADIRIWNRLKEMGIEQWIEEKKKSGKIRNIAFSYHGNSDMFCKIVDAYDWDMCLIQYNYMDEHTQAGRKGLYHAHEKGIPVVIMEPLRGGRLVNNLPDEAKEIFKEHKVQHTPAQWAFRWLWNQPEVTCVLSGMNSLEMVQENVANADASRPGEMDYQVRWELDHLEDADLIIMYILGTSKSPISLLEMGLHARSGKMHVICEKDFYRYDNVRITCAYYDVPLYDDLDSFLEGVGLQNVE